MYTSVQMFGYSHCSAFKIPVILGDEWKLGIQKGCCLSAGSTVS